MGQIFFIFFLVGGGGGFDSLRPSQQLWSCRDGQFTQPHFFPGQA